MVLSQQHTWQRRQQDDPIRQPPAVSEIRADSGVSVQSGAGSMRDRLLEAGSVFQRQPIENHSSERVSKPEKIN